ncbi:MAG: ABC transporter permease [Actinomycetota bacterium]|nr:ABC transporter permease [Actinomycetota bacterium]
MSRARGPRLSTIVRLALAGGGSDALRIVLTAVGALVATSMLLLGVAVTQIGPRDGPYFTDLLNQSGLHPGVVFAMVMLSLVTLSFVGQCSRIGAPARDRRLAAIRMAGGTPRDARTILAAETFGSAFVGALLAGILYLVMHRWFPIGKKLEVGFQVDGQPRDRQLVLPTDVLPHPVAFIVVLLVVPVGASLLGLVALRRTALTPFGVTRRIAHRPPAIAPVVIFLIGAVGLAGFSVVPVARVGFNVVFFLLIPVLFVLTAVGVIFGSASFAYYLGQVLGSRTRRPAVLIACRRMVDAPFTASRSSAAVVLAVLIGAGAQGLRANFLIATSEDGNLDNFFVTAFDLVDIVLAIAIGIAVAGLLVVAAEGVVTRRRTLAALVATGVPRRTLATATLLEVIAPLVPAVLLTTLVGILAARGIYGASATPNGNAKPVGVPVPWANLTVLAGGTLLVATAITALSLLFLRRATDLTELRTAA